MADRNLVHLRLKPAGTRTAIRNLIDKYNAEGDTNTLTSIVSKFLAELVRNDSIPPKYRTK